MADSVAVAPPLLIAVIVVPAAMLVPDTRWPTSAAVSTGLMLDTVALVATVSPVTACEVVRTAPLCVRSRLSTRFIEQTTSVSLTTSTLAHSATSPTVFAAPLMVESYAPRTRYTCAFVSSGRPVLAKVSDEKPSPCTSIGVTPSRVFGPELGDTVMPLE